MLVGDAAFCIGGPVSSVVAMGNVKLPGGAFVNRELFKLNRDIDCYDKNAGMSHEITEEQLETVLEYYTSHSYYILYQNNCAIVATGAWREAIDDDFSVSKFIVCTPANVKNAIMDNGGGYYNLKGLFGTDPLSGED